MGSVLEHLVNTIFLPPCESFLDVAYVYNLLAWFILVFSYNNLLLLLLLLLFGMH